MVGQLVVDGLVSGLLLALPALALTIVFGILKFPNFAVGATLTLGAYTAWVINTFLHLSLLEAGAISALIVAGVLVLSDVLIFVRLRDRGSIVLLVASLGLSLILENICRFAFGNSTRNFNAEIARPMRWHGLRINHEQFVAAITVILCVIVVQLLLYASPLGRAMRATADNPALAAVRGIERETIVRITWALSGALLAMSGVLAGLDRAVDPLLGWNYQIPVFAAAILGGLGNPLGAVIGALVIGLTEELSTLILPTNYRQVVSFGIILLLLLIRTQGLLGGKAVRR
ncbi:branched-chain amino acid ABC transporter permease [Bradyrhizobium canariense]|uniref:Branched-chain amino acid transport system permease protein n=1 Tax=Bradyrhizobium canariense TaxID=255045 RepID=A0A1H1SNM3_9BRAD|nr:branched-chain amino acid ABC transporter permease [Bradyrhizobium canariense]SDS49565.1 branched-chain amino acid transport system permease protein [Bradyrhizobium canariense]